MIDMSKGIARLNALENDKFQEALNKYPAFFEITGLMGTHFSGNMWRTKAEYVKTLSAPLSSNRFDAERWICGKNGRFASSAVSEAAGYDRLLPEWKYADAERKPSSL